ncbi:MAG: phosphatase PAP2 family protein [Sideroxydans sp.]|nr:phosphatase PAP2 family protein [Sideroxydans sp.]
MNPPIVTDDIAAHALWRWSVPIVALVSACVIAITASNAPTFLFLNHAFSALGDSFWSHVTVLGDVAAFLLILLFCGRRPQVLWQFLIAGILAIIWVQSLKSPLGVLRPPAVLGADEFHLIGAALQNNSFPSGHTTTLFVVVGVLCLQRLHPALKFSLLTLALLVGASRIACGVHWPLDVLGGMFGGWLAALAAQWLGLRWRVGLHAYAQRAISLLLLLIAGWMLLRTPHDFIDTNPFQMGLAAMAIAVAAPGLLRVFGMNKRVKR